MPKATSELFSSHSCNAVIKSFGKGYLRAPTAQRMKQILTQFERRDGAFRVYLEVQIAASGPGKVSHCSFRTVSGNGEKPTVKLEAISDSSLWLWHIFVGMPWRFNDLNVLHPSPVVPGIVSGA